jgi:outer membrane receptor protein involved in Fe transport
MALLRCVSTLCLLTLLFPTVRAQDTLHNGRADTLKTVRILGQRPAVEKKLDRTVVHVDATLANAGGQAWNVLENTPGVLLDEDGTISLNGKDGVLVLIDDRPTYLEGQALVAFLKSLPAANLEQVELLPTPPARYPAAGGAGIIILRTKRAAKGFRVQLTSNYTQGVYPHVGQTVLVNGQEGPWEVTGMASYAYTRTFFISDRARQYDPGLVTQHFYEDSWAQTVNYMLGLEHRRKAFSWGFLLEGDVNPYHELGHYVDAFYDGAGKTDSISDVRSHFHSDATDVSGNAHLLRSWAHQGRTLSADADIVRYHQEGHQDEVTTTTLGDSSLADIYEMVNAQPFTATIYSLKTDYTDKFGKRFSLETGAQETYSVRQNTGTYQDGAPPTLEPDDSLSNTFHYEEQIRAAYVTLREEGKRLEIQGGLRLENTWGRGHSSGNLDSGFHLGYTNLFPSVHAQWNVTDDKRHQVNFSYSRRIERPGYNDLNPSRFYFDRTTYFSGNPSLQPSFSQNLELSYTYKERFTLTAAYSAEEDPLHQVYIAQGSEFFYYMINMDHQYEWGLRSDISTPLTAHWTVNAHAEWMVERYRTALPDSMSLDKSKPYVLVSGSTRYAFGKGWTVEAGGFYKNNVLYAQSILRPTGRLNLTIRKKIAGDRGTVTLAGNDVLRTWIINRDIYLPNATVHFHNVFDRRNVSLTFTYTLGKKGIKTTEHTSGAEAEKSRL